MAVFQSNRHICIDDLSKWRFQHSSFDGQLSATVICRTEGNSIFICFIYLITPRLTYFIDKLIKAGYNIHKTKPYMDSVLIFLLIGHLMVNYHQRLFPLDVKVSANHLRSLPPIHQVPQAEQMILIVTITRWIHKIDLESYYVLKLTIHRDIYTYTYICIYISRLYCTLANLFKGVNAFFTWSMMAYRGVVTETCHAFLSRPCLLIFFSNQNRIFPISW